jgi:small subunit ribosomal protein S4
MRSRPKVRLSRALGIPLTPKSTRYLERRPYPPGVHGRRRRKDSDYRRRLLEKQRLRHQYDLREAQLRRTFAEALRRPGTAGENLIELLERRLDAVLVRAGFARTIYQSRQFVVHRHVTVDAGAARLSPPSVQRHRSKISPPALPHHRRAAHDNAVCRPTRRCRARRGQTASAVP